CLLVAPTVIKEIEMGAKPDQACAQLKLCGNHNDTRAIVQKPTITKELHLSCAVCARALEPVISDITGDYAKIQNVAQNICNNLPAIYRSQCMTLANDEHGYMWKPFFERYTPKMLCELAECTGNPPGNLS
ncbi:hypothetical protein MAR_029792, partial [Mya arenaria]